MDIFYYFSYYLNINIATRIHFRNELQMIKANAYILHLNVLYNYVNAHEHIYKAYVLGLLCSFK